MMNAKKIIGSAKGKTTPDPQHPFGLKEIPPEESLIQYPCDFPIKVMAVSHPDVIDKLSDIVLNHDASFEKNTIEVRASAKGNYTGLTFTIKATSREQLDAVYKALHAHELVKIVL